MNSPTTACGAGRLIRILLVSFTCAKATAGAGESDEAALHSGRQIPIGQFLNHDGSLDLEAVRQSAFEGNLDLDGFDVRLDPATGAPLVSLQSDPDDQYWHELSGPDPGMDNYIYAFTVYNGRLIAGGNFTSAGGTVVNHIAAWDGSSWSKLGAGLNHNVWGLTVYDNKLIAGGGFTKSGEGSVNHIAAWNGSSWSSLGSGMNGPVYAFTVCDSGLIVGGWFTAAGNKVSTFLAEWSRVCCELRMGNADGRGGDQPTIGDISTLVGAKFITGICEGKITCLAEADVNQSGESDPTCNDKQSAILHS